MYNIYRSQKLGLQFERNRKPRRPFRYHSSTLAVESSVKVNEPK